MSTQFNFRNIDWNQLSQRVAFTTDDIQRVGLFLVRRMTNRVIRQLTATGRPLSENSERWIGQKLREGRPTLPLQYTGGIRNPSYYEVDVVDDNTIRIKMIPSYREIHLDLIEISEETGKNYKDWFGIGAEDISLIVDIVTETITARLQELFT